ncbi:MAG: LPXTG cell wall anchor domain-containing protein [Bacteroidales bacterium]|nr:LPXTG cell wall anchor domain-containing protein [Bacteroidales bacterium]
MIYTSKINNFGWELLIDPLSNLLGSGVDKINEQKRTIAEMWEQYQMTQQAKYLADAQNNSTFTATGTQNNTVLFVGIGLIVALIIAILFIILKRK